MIFEKTPLAGVMLLRTQPTLDARGSFARVWSLEECVAHGISGPFVQSSVSFNALAFTTRGMHVASPPAAEGKLVRVERGAIFDAVVDLREESSTYGRAWWIELRERDGISLYIPPHCAHGFQTLLDETTVAYAMTQAYRPQDARTFHWRSPQCAIPWPRTENVIMSEADARAPAFEAARDLGNDRTSAGSG